MALITQDQILNIRPGVQAQTVVHVSQGDVGSTIKFLVYKGNGEFDMTGLTVSVHGVRGDGVGFGPYAVTVNGASASFNLKSAMTAVAGAALAELVISNNAGATIATANFAILIEQATFPVAPTYANDVSVYSRILSYVMNSVIPTEAVTIDDTLSISGAAADAKAVGDALGEIEETADSINRGLEAVETPLAVKVGGTYTSTTRGIFVPCAFEKGHTYRIKLFSAAVDVSYIRITKATTLNVSDAIETWNVNKRYYSRTYVCDSTEAAYVAIVAPAGTVLSTIAFAVYEGGALTEVDRLTGKVDGMTNLFETRYETITETKTEGKYWSIADGTTLVANANYNAYEFTPDAKNYILQGLQIGTLDAAAVIFLDASDRILSVINSATQGDGHTLPIEIPEGCVTVRYSSYANATWDADPRKLAAVPVPESLANYTGAELHGTFSANARAVFIPFDFESGTDYYLRLLSSVETVTSVRVLTAATLNTGDIIANWSVNAKTADLSFFCNTATAKYIGVICDSSVTANTITFEVLKSGALSEADKVNDLLGVVAAGRYASQTRAVIVPCDFKSGKTYYINLESSAQIITELRVTDDPTLNVGDIVANWYPNSRSFERIFTPENDNGKYLVFISDPAVSANTISVKVLNNGYLRASEENATLPDYYYINDYWPGVINDIRTRTQILNGVAFAFVTDLHFTANAGNSKTMLRDILNKTTVPFVVCGGDFPAAYGSESDLYDSGNALVEYRNAVGDDRFYTIRGNHDFTIKTNSSMTTGDPGTGATLPVGAAYNYICREQEGFLYCSAPDHMAWYLEIPSQKVRIIGLNSCDGQSDDTTRSWAVYAQITTSQLEWLVNDALSEDGYSYVFISHIPADPSMRGYNSSQLALHQIIAALANKTTVTAGGVTADFTDSTSIVVCHIVGHSHIDESNVADGVLSIATTCDAYYTDDGHGAARGTITEQAFDVFCIDFDERTIYAVRAGRGSNRSWTY